MKKLVLIITILSFGIQAQAQKSKKKDAKNERNVTKNVEPTIEEQEARRAIAAQTESRMMGPMHQILMQLSGNWKEEMKVWSSPNVEPSIIMAFRDSRLFAEGRFIISTSVGQMGNLPYEGQSVLGYDNTKNVFVKTWIDNMGTSILVLEGTYNDENKTIGFTGFSTDPLTKLPIKISQTLKIIDGENQLLEIFSEPKEGVKLKVMEVKSHRG